MRPTMSPAMNTERMAMISRPFRPTPTPPGLTSPSIMWLSGTAPPIGVKLSCIELTDPFDVPVVEAAQRPEAAGPNRTSLPSMFPPACSEVTSCVAPRSSSRGLPFPSRPMAASDRPTQTMNMIANTARPWRLSFTMWPNVKASANGMMRIAQVSRKLLNGVGFSNG